MTLALINFKNLNKYWSLNMHFSFYRIQPSKCKKELLVKKHSLDKICEICLEFLSKDALKAYALHTLQLDH